VYLSESLRGEPVWLMLVHERYWSIRFGPLHIGLSDSYAWGIKLFAVVCRRG